VEEEKNIPQPEENGEPEVIPEVQEMPVLEMPDKTEVSAAPKKSNGKKVVRVILIALAAVVLCAVVAGAIYFENLLSLINRADEEVLETMSDEQYQALMDTM
jgi:hypothetical protein